MEVDLGKTPSSYSHSSTRLQEVAIRQSLVNTSCRPPSNRLSGNEAQNAPMLRHGNCQTNGISEHPA